MAAEVQLEHIISLPNTMFDGEILVVMTREVTHGRFTEPSPPRFMSHLKVSFCEFIDN